MDFITGQFCSVLFGIISSWLLNKGLVRGKVSFEFLNRCFMSRNDQWLCYVHFGVRGVSPQSEQMETYSKKSTI